MSKKRWIIMAVVILPIVAAIIVYCVPRGVSRVLSLSDGEPASISSYMDVRASVKSYKTEDPQEMAQFLEPLQMLQVKYVNSRNIYEVGEVSADIFVRYDDGSLCRFFISDNGIVRCNGKNYRCADKAALEALLELLESWQLY